MWGKILSWPWESKAIDLRRQHVNWSQVQLEICHWNLGPRMTLHPKTGSTQPHAAEQHAVKITDFAKDCGPHSQSAILNKVLFLTSTASTPINSADTEFRTTSPPSLTCLAWLTHTAFNPRWIRKKVGMKWMNEAQPKPYRHNNQPPTTLDTRKMLEPRQQGLN